jgi:hypothetical protein
MEPSLLLYVAVHVVRNAVPVASPTVRSTISVFSSCYGCQRGVTQLTWSAVLAAAPWRPA